MFGTADSTRAQELVGLVERFYEDREFRDRLRDSYKVRMRTVKRILEGSQDGRQFYFDKEAEEEAVLKEAFFRTLCESFCDEHGICDEALLNLRRESDQLSQARDRSWDPVLVAEAYPEFRTYWPDGGISEDRLIHHFGLAMYDALASTGSDFREHRKLNNYKNKRTPASSPYHDVVADLGGDHTKYAQTCDPHAQAFRLGFMSDQDPTRNPPPVDLRSFRYEDDLLDPAVPGITGVSDVMVAFFDQVCKVTGPRFATYLTMKLQYNVGYREILETYVPELPKRDLERFRRDLDRKEKKFWAVFKEQCKADPTLRQMAEDCRRKVDEQAEEDPPQQAPLVPGPERELYQAEAERRAKRQQVRLNLIENLKGNFDFVSVHRVSGAPLAMCEDLDNLLPKGQFRDARLQPMYGFRDEQVEEAMRGGVPDIQVRLRGNTRYVDVIAALERVRPEGMDISVLVARSVLVA